MTRWRGRRTKPYGVQSEKPTNKSSIRQLLAGWLLPFGEFIAFHSPTRYHTDTNTVQRMRKKKPCPNALKTTTATTSNNEGDNLIVCCISPFLCTVNQNVSAFRAFAATFSNTHTHTLCPGPTSNAFHVCNLRMGSLILLPFLCSRLVESWHRLQSYRADK